MKRTTPPPRKNVLEILPELADRAKVTVRLHPRRGRAADPAASKLGGTILWPGDEPWPCCSESGHYDALMMNEPYPDGTAVTLVPVLQLRSVDFPEIAFKPGTDLMQLLWCPLDHAEPTFVARPFLFWRRADAVRKPLRSMPVSEFAGSQYCPQECQLSPERVVEYPSAESFTARMSQKLANWNIEGIMDDPITFYGWECSVCPSIKIGGYPSFVQGDETPACACGQRMDLLLTLTDSEFDGGTHHRWCPSEDKAVWDEICCKMPLADDRREEIQDPAKLEALSGGSMYIFICRCCPGWPIRSVYQR